MFALISRQTLSFSSRHRSIRNNFMLLLTLSLLLGTAAAQISNNVRTLEYGKPFVRELAGGQSHSYRIMLTSGQYLHIVVDQRGIDVIVTLFAPDGKQVVEVDSPNDTQGPEPVFAITESSGAYRLEVRSFDKNAPGGRYQVKIEELRAAIERDKSQVAAERSYAQASLLSVQGTVESFRDAIKKYNEALSLFRAAGDRTHEASTLNNIGFIYGSIGENQKAIDYLAQALQAIRAVGDRRGEATTLSNIGIIYDLLGEKEKALNYFMQALPLFRTVGDRIVEARVLTNIGAVFGSLGEQQKALEYYERAGTLFRAVGDIQGEAVTLTGAGTVYANSGDKQKALDYFIKALPLIRTIGDHYSEAITLGSIGAVYANLGYKQKALDYYTQALVLSRSVGDRYGEAMMLTRLGLIYDGLGEKQKALHHFNQALLLYRNVGDPRGEATTLINIAGIYTSLGQQDEALNYYGQALTIRRKNGDSGVEPRTLNNNVAIQNALDSKLKSLEYAQALSRSRAVKDRDGEAKALSNLMSVYQKLNNPRFAIFYGKQAVNTFQQQRFNIQDSEVDTQRSYLKSVEQTYRVLAEALITRGRTAEAQQVLNAFKDQQVFDPNQGPSRSFKPLTLTPLEAAFTSRLDKIIDNISRVDTQMAELNRALGSHQFTDQEAKQLNDLDLQRKDASNEYSALLKQAEAEFSKTSDESDKAGEVPDTAEMREILRQLNQETGQEAVAVYTLVGTDHFYTLLVTSDGITSASSIIKGDDLNKKALQLWALLQSDNYDPKKLSNELYNVIFKPIEDKLPRNTKTIIWSLDENLRYIPMAALYDGRQYLVERYGHVVFTRAEKERLTRAMSSVWTGYGFATSIPHKVALFGNSIYFNSITFVKDEMQVFRTKTYPDGIIDGDILSEDKFTKASLLAMLRQKRPVIHISSHFRFRPGDASNSFLLLGDDQVMTLAEMEEQLNLFQGVELLTLSACDTAVQRPDSTGKEVDAFAEIAQRLGASSVLASLWAVLDKSTAQLMKGFYRNREYGKLSKAEALRKAQLDLLYGNTQDLTPSTYQGSGRRGDHADDDNIIVEKKYRILFKVDKDKAFAHPFYWSPFVLFGNWK